jgi:hypothetical protein
MRFSPDDPIQQLVDSPFTPKWSNKSVPTGPDGRPLLAEFQTVGDTQTGLLKSPYNLQQNLDMRGMEALRGEALRDPNQMSRWGQLALSQQQNQGANQMAGSLSQARNQLAMQGGLRSGARERLASQGMRQQMLGNQGALSQIQMADEQNRQKALAGLPGQEIQTAQYQSGISDKNISRALNEIFQGRQNQQGSYNEAMKGWGSAMTAASTPNSSKK